MVKHSHLQCLVKFTTIFLYKIQLKPELDSYRIVLRNTFQLIEVLKPSELQVDLIIDDEQKAMWQFKETLAPTHVSAP